MYNSLAITALGLGTGYEMTTVSSAANEPLNILLAVSFVSSYKVTTQAASALIVIVDIIHLLPVLGAQTSPPVTAAVQS